MMTRHEGGACGKGFYHEAPCDPPAWWDTRAAARTVVAASGRARLWRNSNGLLRCECPYACMAACEPCEFADPKYDENGKPRYTPSEPQPEWERRLTSGEYD